MRNSNQNQPSVYGYPPQPPAATAFSAGPHVAPPPAGYPMKDIHDPSQNPAAVETRAKGDGFWKGCCAALCCCCLLDACF